MVIKNTLIRVDIAAMETGTSQASVTYKIKFAYLSP